MKVKGRTVSILIWSLLIGHLQILYAAEEMKTAAAETDIDAVGDSFEFNKFIYKVNEDGKSVTISGYLGTETEVEIPEQIEGKTVTHLCEPFQGNVYVKNVIISKTVISLGELSSCIGEYMPNLQNIYVAAANPIFFDENGILYRRSSYGMILCQYPSARIEDTYKIPNQISFILPGAFYQVTNLTKVIIPATCQSVYFHAFIKSKLTIYVADETYLGYEAFKDMLPGTKIIVKSPEMKESVLNAIYPEGDPNIEIIDLSKSDDDTKAEYTISSESLLFTNGSAEKSVTWIPNTTYTLYDLYTQFPTDATESVTWTVSDTALAAVDNAKQTIKTKSSSGDFDLTGTDESGHSITLHIKIYIPFTSCTLPGTAVVSLGYEGCFYAAFEPITAYAAANVTYKSSNPDIIEITDTVPVKCGDNQEGTRVECYYKAKKLGMTTITATVNDNGKITTMIRDFVVDSEYYLSTHADIEYFYINGNYMSAENYSIAYTGNQIELTPVVCEFENGIPGRALTENIEYTTSYINNISPGKATVIITGEGDYYGTITKEFTITPKPISECIINSIGSMEYTGKEIKPIVTIKNGNVTLIQDRDYTLTYVNNKNPGTATITIAGEGNYSGSVKKTFMIGKAAQKISGATTYVKTYGTGAFALNAKSSGNGALSYSSSNQKVAAVSSKGKVTINGTGITTITVTATETATVKTASMIIKLTVVPKKGTITSLKSVNKAGLTVKWKRDTTATGYEIQYSTSSKFALKETETVNINKSTTVAKTIKKLKSGKKYYVRIRAYKTVKENGKNVKRYGQWSGSKSVKRK